MYRAVGTEECKGAKSLLQILADQLTLFQPGEAECTQHITTFPLRIFEHSYGPEL